METSTDTHGINDQGWYGFDLDGTLAVYNGWQGIDHIGEPVKPMVDLIKRMHDEGTRVKIVTARAAPRDEQEIKPNPYFTIPNHVRQHYSTFKYLYYSREWNAKTFIIDWCLKNLGFVPEITHEKDGLMIELYDDRVKQVIPNEGILVEDKVKELEAKISKPMIEDSTTDKMRKALEATLAAFKSGAIHTCSECYRDEWDDELSDLKAIVESALEAPSQQVVNLSAVREALSDLKYEADNCYETMQSVDNEQDVQHYLDAEKVSEKCASALSVLPRNCDRFNTGDVVKDADDALHAILEEGAIGFRSVAQYLLSPAG